MTRLIALGWLACAFVFFAIYLIRPGNELVLSLVVLFVVAIAIVVMKEQLRRRREGFYISKKGNADGGDLIYHEGDKLLSFYFDRRGKTVYIPSEPKWENEMPDWVNKRRSEVVGRIKKRVGAAWRIDDAE